MIPNEIADRSIGFDSSLASTFKEILSGKSFGAKTQAPKKKEAPKQLSPEEAQEQEKALQKFYPNYMVDQGFRMGTFPMYMTIDQDHPSYLHTTQYGQGLMYDMGDAAIVHCFTQEGQYYKVRLGLDKSKDEVHSFYVDPGTFIAIEDADDTGAGFSLINTEIPTNGNGAVLVPKYDTLLRLFPEQREIIERLTVKQ
ncbi:Sir2 silent information regulator family NAD-dependent deacetylase [Lactobacillus kefiranofaciens]|nr:Sir2 silent information regulator family NAD-dependent deacetylase [Lactobacillus kefiranofaciens]QFQ68911.1 Sir2 silent information regulator family NAD-dependent deacetylase [Lactobacillus kefiranofaciens subsp. kefiranofaciens]